jgi:hypothetical protein
MTCPFHIRKIWSYSRSLPLLVRSEKSSEASNTIICRASIMTSSLVKEPRRFAPLRAQENGNDPKLKGVVFDVDGTLWWVLFPLIRVTSRTWCRWVRTLSASALGRVKTNTSVGIGLVSPSRWYYIEECWAPEPLLILSAPDRFLKFVGWRTAVEHFTVLVKSTELSQCLLARSP